MFDLVLKNGTIVNDGKVFEADIAITNERIEQVDSMIASEAHHEINLEGKHIIPGLIASWMDRQGISKTVSVILIIAISTRLIMIIISGGTFYV